MRVLLITYYWPPAGGVAVQRWMKYAKFISQEPDIDLVVYCPEDADYPEEDPSLLKEIEGIEQWKAPIVEPYGLFRTLTGKKKKYKVKQEFAAAKNKSALDDFAVWIRGNFFIPDARVWWVKPSIRLLSKKWKDSPFDVVISNGTPHSVHLIALGLKKKFDFKWIADFRDPWTKVDYFHELHLTQGSKQKHEALEQAVLQTADHVVTVSPTWVRDFKQLGAKSAHLITNGYDPEDFPKGEVKLDDKFTIAHIGNFNKKRNKKVLWECLQQLCESEPGFKEDLQIRILGSADPSVHEDIGGFGLKANLLDEGNVSHEQALSVMQSARVLYLPVGDDQRSEGRIPAKVFEYMAAGRPILSIAPLKSDLRLIVDEAHAGKVFEKTENEAISKFILDQYHDFKSGNKVSFNPKTSEYERSALAKKFLKLIRS